MPLAQDARATPTRRPNVLDLRAKVIGIQPVQLSRHKGGHMFIGKMPARRFEERLQKQRGWLGEQHPPEGMTLEESTQVVRFLHLSRQSRNQTSNTMTGPPLVR